MLEYWIEADDNRTPKPNTIATEHKTLRIVSPDPAQQPPPDRIAQNDQPQQQMATRRASRASKAGERGGEANRQQSRGRGQVSQQSQQEQGEGSRRGAQPGKGQRGRTDSRPDRSKKSR